MHACGVQESDILWFCGNIYNMLFVNKIPGLESLQVRQISKLKTNLLYRIVIQVGLATCLHWLLQFRGHVVGAARKRAAETGWCRCPLHATAPSSVALCESPAFEMPTTLLSLQCTERFVSSLAFLPVSLLRTPTPMEAVPKA